MAVMRVLVLWFRKNTAPFIISHCGNNDLGQLPYAMRLLGAYGLDGTELLVARGSQK